MSSSIITTVISTLLLVAYVAAVANFLSSEDFIYPFFTDCSPTSCHNSIIQYPFRGCGLLAANCLHNQTTQLYYPPFYARVVGDITNSSYSTRTLQITLSPQDGDLKIMHGWLTDVGFFNVSAVPGGFKITWSISHTCRSCLATGGRCVSRLDGPILAQRKNYDDYCLCPNSDQLQFRNCSDDGEDIQNFIS